MFASARRRIDVAPVRWIARRVYSRLQCKGVWVFTLAADLEAQFETDLTEAEEFVAADWPRRSASAWLLAPLAWGARRGCSRAIGMRFHRSG